MSFTHKSKSTWIAVLVIVFLLVNAFSRLRSNNSSEIQTLYEFSNVEYLHDIATDTLIVYEEYLEEIKLINLETKEIVYEDDGTGPAFYVPGKYLHVDTDKVLLLKTLETIPLVEAQRLNFEDSKTELLKLLADAKVNGTEAYSDNEGFGYSYFLIKESKGYFYQGYDQDVMLPNFEQMVKRPLSSYSTEPSERGMTYVLDDFTMEGPNGIRLEIKDTSIDIVGAGRKSKNIKVFKDGSLVGDFDIKRKFNAYNFIFFPQDREEIFIPTYSALQYIKVQ